jgi:methyl-accepting chemotaxis protein
MKASKKGIAKKVGFYSAFTILAFLIITTALIIVEIVSSNDFARQCNADETMNSQALELAGKTAGLQSKILQCLLTNDSDSITIYLAHFDTLRRNALRVMAASQADISSVTRAFDSLTSINRSITTEIRKGNIAEASRTFVTQSNPAFERLRKQITSFRSASVCKSKEAVSRIRNDTIVAGMIALLAAGIIAAASIIWNIRFRRAISGQVNRLIEMLSDMAEGKGDLTKRLAVSSGDELGVMAGLINDCVQRQQSILSLIADNTGALSALVYEIGAVADTIVAQSATIAQQSASVNSATTETSTGITGISSSVEDMSALIASIASAAEGISITFKEVATNCQKESSGAADAAGRAKTNRDLMRDLGKITKQIDNILATITKIAEQTNLLALNATIEAASAGEAGRGFSVVATEVKSLARLTAKATVQIADQIEQIKKSVTDSIRESEKILEVIEQVSAISASIASAVEEQSATVNEVTHNIIDASTTSEAISSSVTNGAHNLTKIAKNVHMMDDALIENRNLIETIRKSASRLAETSARLEAVVKKFKIV